MDPPNSYMEVNPENPMYHCDLFDAEIVHKIAQAFLPGLASACVDNTTGGLFKSPGSVAVEVRKEMVGYLTQRSETFVAESVTLDGAPGVEIPEHPYDIISNHIDDFAGSKRNFFSKVSTWLLSDRREDRIDDFVQEMEMSGFWLNVRREAVAKTLLRNVDFKNEYHCNVKFNSAQQLSDHIPKCNFRTIICTSEGCNARFCAAHLENHESVCPFKIIPCEQKCPEEIMRRDMDRHCITVCPMKLVNCSFYPVGCQSTIPRCNVEEHNSESLESHLVYILQTIHKDVSKEDLKKRAEQIEKESSPGKLAGARDVRSLTYMVKILEAKLEPIEITPPKASETEEIPATEEESKESPKKEILESPNDNKESKLSPTKENELIGTLDEMKDSSEVVAKAEGSVESSNGDKEKKQSPTEKNELIGSPSKMKDSSEVVSKTEGILDSPAKIDAASESSSDGEQHKEQLTKKEKHLETGSTISKDDGIGSPHKREEHTELTSTKEEGLEELTTKEESMKSLTIKNTRAESPSGKEELVESPTKTEEHIKSPSSPESPGKNEKLKELPASPESPDKKEKSKESPSSPESPSKKENFKESPTKKEGSKDSPSSSDSE